MSTSSSTTINYDKISKKCCGMKGLRLSPRRFSVQRLRTKFLYIFGLFRRWKNSYRNTLRQLRRINLGRRKSSSSSKERVLVDRINGAGYLYSSSAASGIRSMGHSNSFCSEAIADCLEFIKRNSVSLEDERKPMLKQE